VVATVIALGGAEIGDILPDGRLNPVASEKTHLEILARTKKKHPRVLYVPTAIDDSGGHIASFRQYYLSLGAGEVDVLRLIGEKPSSAKIKDKIFGADVVYVNGGNTYRMLKLWKRHGVDRMLKRAHRQGVIMSGYSAGAICWFRFGCSDSFYKKKPFKLTAMGMYRAVLCPHFDTESVRRPALKKIMARTPAMVSIALDENAAIELIDNRYRILTTQPTANARRTFWKNGRYVVEIIPPDGKFRDLETLLTKP
jgi:dipeptidase E